MAKHRNLSDRAAGTAKEIGGKVQGGVGALLDDPEMEIKGRVKEEIGHEQKEDAKTRERVKGKIEEVAGAVKSGVGRALGDDEMALKGKAKEIKGTVRQDANEPEDLE